ASHRNVFLRILLIKSRRQESIVFQISNSEEQAGGHVTCRILQDGLVDLDLVRACDLLVVRLKLQRVAIVMISFYRTVSIQCTRFKNSLPVSVADHELQPNAA